MRHLSRRSGISHVEVGIVAVIALLVLGLFLVYLPQAHVNNQRGAVHGKPATTRAGHHAVSRRQGRPKAPEGQRGYLPAARIAEGYATWPVQIAPLLSDASPLKGWDMQRRAMRSLRPFVKRSGHCFCAPPGSVPAGSPAKAIRSGAVGDYACVSGNGAPQHPWTGPDANGPIILGEVLEQKDGLILRWRGPDDVGRPGKTRRELHVSLGRQTRARGQVRSTGRRGRFDLRRRASAELGPRGWRGLWSCPIQALPSTSISAAITTGSSGSWLPTAASAHVYGGHERASAGTVSQLRGE